MQVEGGAHGLELEGQHLRLGQLAAQQVQQQRGDQRAVHDQARIALHARDVAAVGVGAGGGGGQGRGGGKQHTAGGEGARPRFLGRPRRRLWGGRRGGGIRRAHTRTPT